MNGVKKLYISVLSLLLVVIMLGTATYAWITLTTITNVDGLTLSASSGDELQISLDGVTYFNKMSGNLVMEKLKELSLTNVTSNDGVNFYHGGLNPEDLARANKDYISLTMWFRTSDAHRSIYLIDNVSSMVEYDNEELGTYVISRGVEWKSNMDFQNGPEEDDVVRQGEQRTYYASQAIRISFVEKINEYNPLDTRTEEELIRLVYDPSENPERGFGVAYGALDYFNRVTEIDKIPPEKPETLYSLTEFLPNNPYIPENEDSKVMELMRTEETDPQGRAYYVGKITINIWLEGWDADCLDAIFRDRIKVQLKFKAGTPNPSWLEDLGN